MSGRVYLDWNATAPLRPEARAAMLQAMDVVGNPSSVHAEGRAARAILNRARTQVAALVGSAPEEVVFTSGATEANTMALTSAVAYVAATEHDSVIRAAEACAMIDATLSVDAAGRVDPDQALLAPLRPTAWDSDPAGRRVVAVAAANGETGVIDDVASVFEAARGRQMSGHCDMTQAVGRLELSFLATGASTASVSAHKIGGPKGIGAFIHDSTTLAGQAFSPRILYGGGQERGWRAGTENVIGAAGFGAAAEAAWHEREAGVWDRVAQIRNLLEERLAAAAPGLIFVGDGAARLPNTTCFALPGWRGDTQVIQMDLAGFAVSAGAACSSGRVGPNRVLRAIGLDDATAAAAIRVSLGPTTTEDAAMAFAEAWVEQYRRFRKRAA